MISQKDAELISLAATVPTIVLACVVVYLWFPAAIRAFNRERKQATDWFILGVVCGFLGSIFDNFYWAFPWTAYYLDHENATDLAMRGVYFNIFLRQGLGSLAAFCHIKSATLSHERKMKHINQVLIASAFLGMAFALYLHAFHSC